MTARRGSLQQLASDVKRRFSGRRIERAAGLAAAWHEVRFRARANTSTEKASHPLINALLHSTSAAVAGGVLWILLLALLRPRPLEVEWAVALLLLAPLVLVPLGLRLVPNSPGSGVRPLRGAVVGQLPAALCLGAAFLLPAGPTAAALTLPWLAVTALVALAGLLRLRSRGIRPLEQLCIDAGLLYLPIGAVWVALARYGARPLEFEPVIVLLTGIHFHYAGFVLPLLTGLAAAASPGAPGRLAAAGVAAGVPAVAAGITATQLSFSPLFESAAACLLALAGGGSGLLHLQLAARAGFPRPARALWLLCGLSLLAGVALAALYGLRPFRLLPGLDIPWMRATHGTAAALGFALPGLLGWTVAGALESSNTPAPGA